VNELEVCLLLREQHLAESSNQLVALMSKVQRAGLQGVAVGDHVTFQGAGTDGLISAAALIAAHDSLLVKTIIYLVPLRHPVAIARQVATLAELGPGRFTFGVGVGGEDPDEFASVEVPFDARGARADEALELMERLRSGRPVTHHGRFFKLDEVVIAPAVPGLRVVVGGRSDAALRRTARFGEGWAALWVSARRYAEATAMVETEAARAGRGMVAWRHEHQGWCFFDHDRAVAIERARRLLEASYAMPFERFERYTPCGGPEEVAATLRPFYDAGCRTFNLVADGPSLDYIIECAGQVRELMSAWTG
jgi:alkanesulfonate monooxygenase SsuD/methylene tetrahydromethanopterin reductase-like flavin-dependent oxidoreductase (luciferase family)